MERRKEGREGGKEGEGKERRKDGRKGGREFQQVIERPASLCGALAKTLFLFGLSFLPCQMRELSMNGDFPASFASEACLLLKHSLAALATLHSFGFQSLKVEPSCLHLLLKPTRS